MIVRVSGMIPMMACAKGRDGLSVFRPELLWAPPAGDWFDPKVELSGRGFKYFNSATRYLIAAVKQLDDPNDNRGGHADFLKGVVVGSNSCTRQELDEIDHSVLEHGFGAIHPMRAPSFCANMGTAAVSIKHQAKAFNLTLTNPMTAGLDAVALARQAIMDGRASCVIAGAMEDDAEFILANDSRFRTTGGAWAFRLESEDGRSTSLSGTPSLSATVGPTISRFVPPILHRDHESLASFRRSLEEDFAPLIASAPNLMIRVSMLQNEHSRRIAESLMEVFSRFGIPSASVDIPGDDTRYGTLHSLSQFAWSCLSKENAMCVAISPLGHLTAVRVANEG